MLRGMRPDIEKKIISSLDTSTKTWTEIYDEVKVDKASKTKMSRNTLSGYLDEFEKEGLIIREVNPDRTVHYKLNQPPHTGIALKLIELDKQLTAYEKLDKTHPDGKGAAIGYYDKFIWIMFDLIAIHVWASKFQNPEIAENWIRAMTEIILNETYVLGQEAPVLMKHRDAVQTSAKDYLIYLLEQFPKGRLKSDFTNPKFIEDYLAFDPTPGLRKEK